MLNPCIGCIDQILGKEHGADHEIDPVSDCLMRL